MRRRTLFVILSLLAAAVVLATLLGTNAINLQTTSQSYTGPVEIAEIKAKVTGGSGSEIVVEYSTLHPMANDLGTNETHIIHEATGKILGVQWIPIVGYVGSKSKGYADRWFMIHNADAKAGDLITVVIGSVAIEHYALLPMYY